MFSRRALLKAGGLAAVSFGAGPAFLQRAALAASEPAAFHRRKTLVTLFQRGAMDGLMAVAPLGGADEASLKKLRPRLAMSAAGSATRNGADGALLDLGSGFGLHPAFAPLKSLWDENRLAVVHGVGSPDPSRSHFDAQDFMETGTPGDKGTSSGWLNRVCGLLGHEATPFRAVSVTKALPRSLYGLEPAIAVADLADFKVQEPMGGGRPLGTGKGFEALYEQTSQELLRDTGGGTFDAIEMLSRAEIGAYQPARGAIYPRGPLGDALRQVAMLVKSDVGLEVAFVESGGWDTHVQQGTDRGSFAQRSRDLAQAIAALWTDLGTYQDDVVLMTMTEFGRTARENGSGGTDHGHGSCLFVLGNTIDGGKVHGRLPRLVPENLYEGRDLPVTTDFRAVFSEVAGRQFGIDDDGALFPDWKGPRLPLFHQV